MVNRKIFSTSNKKADKFCKKKKELKFTEYIVHWVMHNLTYQLNIFTPLTKFIYLTFISSTILLKPKLSSAPKRNVNEANEKGKLLVL